MTTKNKFIDDVNEFQEKFGFKKGIIPSLPNRELMDFRLKLLEEEVKELKEAQKYQDLAEVSDALVDIIYVAIGTARLYGIPLDKCWDEVHKANMAKERTNSLNVGKRGAPQFDVSKPASWMPPNHKKILNAHGANLSE